MIKYNLRKKIYNHSLTQRKIYFPSTDEMQNSESSCIWKNTMQLIGFKGDRYSFSDGFARFPVGKYGMFSWGVTYLQAACVHRFVLLRDEPGKMSCAFQEGNKENVRIYSNIIV